MRSAQHEIFEALHSLPGDRGSFGIMVASRKFGVYAGFRVQ